MNPVLVGNWHESAEITRRAIASCAKHVSGFAISIDSASAPAGFDSPGAYSDLLIAEIKPTGLPVFVYETPRVSGEQIRTEIMRAGDIFARHVGATYMLNLDADDELEFADDFAWPWKHDEPQDCYWLIERFRAPGTKAPHTYPFKRLFRVGLGWAWYGPLHEEPYCASVPLGSQSPIAAGVTYVKHVDGFRGTPEERYGGHAKIIRAWLDAQPREGTPDGDTTLAAYGRDRYGFYLAQSLFGARLHEEARDAYEAYLEMTERTLLSPGQRYRAAMEIAHLAQLLGGGPLDVLNALLCAIELAPHRAEPYRLVAQLANAIADGLPVPVGEILVDASAYGPRAPLPPTET